MWRLLILYLCGLMLRSLIFAALAGLITMRMRSVVRRHAVWTSFLGCLLLMPLADALLPSRMVPARAPEIVLPVQTFVVVAPESAFPTDGTLRAAFDESRRDWWQIAGFLWIAVATIFLCRLALACGEIARIRRTGNTVSSGLFPAHVFRFRTLTMRESSAVKIPLTVGLCNPALILPLDWRDWDSWKLRAVLAHELTHVRRMDWAIAVVASFVRCVFWFNPLTWWLERHLSSLAEQASDEACVQITGDAPRYAETLLHFASVAKHGRRWIGGVAMAQYKISSRIERVLRLQKAGSGLLSKAGWVAVCMLAISMLYVSAAAQSRTTTRLPALSPAEIVRVVQQGLPVPEQQSQIQHPQNSTSPAPPAPAIPTTPQVNPDLVGEIRLILTPVEQAQGTAPGQIQIQTRTGNNRYTGNAVWNVQNGALNPNTWARNRNGFTFAMTGAQGRILSFENSQGGTFSYGCPDCSFLASELGVSASSANSVGILFHLSSDARSVMATCRAVECRVGTSTNWTLGRAPFDDTIRILKDSQTLSLPVPQQPSADPTNSGLRCFSVFGNVKVDGTPFTAADCPGGTAITPSSVVFFSVTR
jgi:beta-lactamase regulating signal transducer with metallopeptidase domain